MKMYKHQKEKQLWNYN